MSEQNQSHNESQQATGSAQIAPQASRQSWRQNVGIPVAIVVAALLISAAIFFDGDRRGGTLGTNDGAENAQVTPERNVAPVTKDDHIRGNPNAPIVIVEYSDYDCPFCRVHHDTMKKLIEEYGKNGKVAWVYRHFPIAQLHPGAPKMSEAAYCVVEQGGNDAFWKYTDALNGSRKVTYDDATGRLTDVEPTDMKRISEFAVSAGVDKAKFELCYNSGKYAEKVKADIQAAVAAGAQGTPYSVIIAGGQQMPIDGGAVPYEFLTGVLDELITKLEL